MFLTKNTVLSTKSKNNRNSKYEFLRFLTATMVILFHASFINRSTGFYTEMNTLLVMPVILFLFMSGYFMVISPKSRIIKFSSILLVYYLFNLLFSFVMIKSNVISSSINFGDVIKSGGGPGGYFGSLPFLYIAAPFINLSIKSFTKWPTLVALIAFYLCYLFFGQINYSTGKFGIFGVGQVMLFITIYGLGAGGRIHETSFSKQKLVLVFAIIYLLILQFVNNLLFGKQNTTLFFIFDQGAKDTSNPLTVLAAGAIFIIFEHVNLKDGKFFNFLGKISLPIYLFHVVFMQMIELHLFQINDFNNQAIGIIAFSGLTLLCVASFAALIIGPIDYAINQLYKLINYLIKQTKRKITGLKVGYDKLSIKTSSNPIKNLETN